MRRLLPSLTAVLAAVFIWTSQAVAATPAPPDLQVASASLIVGGTGQVLYGDHAGEERAIASTTKIMTALITLQHVHHLGTIFTQMNFVPAADDSQIGLVPGERMSVRDLMYALLIPSADDAAMDLAYNVGGHSVARFVAMMNAEARKLGLTRTHYSTPSGLDTPGNYSTSYDLVKLANYVMAHYRFFRRVVAMQSATLTTGRYVRHVTTTDYLLGEVPWIHGIKTGHTDDAGYVLVSEGRRDGFTLIGDVLDTDSEAARDANALALLEWGYANFHKVTAIHRGTVMARPAVKDSSTRAIVVAKSSYSRVVPRSSRVRVVKHLRPGPLAGPLARGAVVGSAAVFVGHQQVGSVPLVLGKALPKISVLVLTGHVLVRASSLLLFALALGVAGVFTVRRRRPRSMVARSRS